MATSRSVEGMVTYRILSITLATGFIQIKNCKTYDIIDWLRLFLTAIPPFLLYLPMFGVWKDMIIFSAFMVVKSFVKTSM